MDTTKKLNPLQQWHEFVKTGNTDIFDEILAEDVIFYSPVVWKPQAGQYLTKMYLMGAMHVLGKGGFHYLKEIISENQACLEFETQIGEIIVNGVDIISWNEAGKITEFKVMIRPKKAVEAVWKEMVAMLEKLK